MVSKKLSDTNPNARASWRTVLGISDSDGIDWGLVRAAQINAVRRVSLQRLLMVIVSAGVIAASLHKVASPLMLYSWLGGVVLVAFLTCLPQLRDRHYQLASATRGDLHRETLGLLVTAVSWASLPIVFGATGQPEHLLMVWSVSITLMAAASFGLSALPMATTVFLTICGGGLVTMAYLLNMPAIAGVAFVNTTILVAAALVTGRTFVEHRAAEIALKEKSEVVSLLLREYEDSGGDWMWQTDASRCLTHVSPRMAVALGKQPDELESKPFLQILTGADWETGNFSAGLRDLAERLKNRESFSDLVVPIKVNGETFWWEMSASPRFDDNGAFAGFRGVSSDVSDAHRAADKINKMARFDTLTGLPNRLHVEESLEAVMKEADQWRTRCGFMMIDLDRFKAVNDTLGHPMGDRLLTHVSKRLKSVIGDQDMCGRLGGDEFAVVVKDANDPGKLERLAQQIIDTISKPYVIDQHTLYIGASIGTAIGPRDGRTVEMLTRSADLALYRSKDKGGNVVNAYEPQLHVHAEERRVLEIALRKALERNEFEVYYQPVVSAHAGIIESFEALLRWKNPELGMVSPAKFVPVAEDARLIGPIGEWVLRTACQEAISWPPHVRVAVNVSAEQLNDPNFVTTVVSALSNSGLPPARLELEVTESVFMREGTQAVAVLDRILSLGVRLSLDDFGTGYSSLGYLSKTKFSTIKVDRSFVQGAARHAPESIAIIRAVVALAESLGMATTAEGVETEAECRMVNELGCRKIQGYLFGRPMQAKDARRLFDDESQQVA